jgi:hypothetical protein
VLSEKVKGQIPSDIDLNVYGCIALKIATQFLNTRQTPRAAKRPILAA